VERVCQYPDKYFVILIKNPLDSCLSLCYDRENEERIRSVQVPIQRAPGRCEGVRAHGELHPGVFPLNYSRGERVCPLQLLRSGQPDKSGWYHEKFVPGRRFAVLSGDFCLEG